MTADGLSLGSRFEPIMGLDPTGPVYPAHSL